MAFTAYIFFLSDQDEWLTCQRNWLYLGSIFVAPDIKRQLLAESKMFQKVGKSWKEVMAKANTRPLKQPHSLVGSLKTL